MTQNPLNKAIVLLSGGLDSTTVLAIAQDLGFECSCLSFSYGQRQLIELERSISTAKHYGVKEHLILRLDLDKIGGSALTAQIQVPKSDRLSEERGHGAAPQIPVTYVPARNSIFLSHAVAWGEVIGAYDIFIGVNVMDYSGYPDCRPQFLEAFAAMANIGTKAGAGEGRKFKIHAPLLHLTKKEIIQRGLELGVDYSNTHSCYDPGPDGLACGRCEACLLRLRGFAEAQTSDPIKYNDA